MISSEHFTPIAELDLEPIKVKLMHEESGEGWSLDKVNAVEFEYRRFLYLMKMFPNEQTAPLMDVDTFWHYHILDTMKYAVDCDKVFGYFLHHFPYIGLRGEDDVAAHRRVGDRMKELYEETFGDAYLRNAAPAYSGAIGTEPAATAYSGRATTETAYSGAVGAATAYSGAATAYSGAISAATAYSGAATASSDAISAATAYSGAATAYSGAISAATAYSGAATASSGAISAATAYSGAAAASPGRIGTESAYSGRIAYSGSVSEPTIAAKPAYSGRLGSATTAVETAFYSERPRLA